MLQDSFRFLIRPVPALPIVDPRHGPGDVRPVPAHAVPQLFISDDRPGGYVS
jgi:hypothetical protein